MPVDIKARQRAQEPEPAGAAQNAREPPLSVSPVIPAIPAIPAIPGNSSEPLLFRMPSGTPKILIAHRRPHAPAAWLRACYNYTLVWLLPNRRPFLPRKRGRGGSVFPLRGFITGARGCPLEGSA